MRTRIFSAFAIAVLLVISYSGCGSKGGLEKEIKASIQNKMDTEIPFKDYAIQIGTVKLVKAGTYAYKGTAIVTASGQSHEVIIDVVSDGQDAVWAIEPLSFAFLANAPEDTLRAGLRSSKVLKEIKSGKPSAPNERTDFKYDLNKTKDGVVILQYVGTRSDVVVPATIDGFPVVNIAEKAFEKNENITSVVLQPPLQSISYGSFQECKNLVIVALPDTLMFIDGAAFYKCQSLVSIAIPDSVMYIGRWAFQDCISLSSVVLSNNIESIERQTFFGCSLLTTIKIPESVGYIFPSAFNGCSNLLTVELPPHPIIYIGGNTNRKNDGYSVVFDGDAVHRYADTVVQDINIMWGGRYYGYKWEKSEITWANLNDTVEINDFSEGSGERFTARDSRGDTYRYYKRVYAKYSISPNPKNSAFTGCFRLDLQTRSRIEQSGYEGGFN